MLRVESLRLHRQQAIMPRLKEDDSDTDDLEMDDMDDMVVEPAEQELSEEAKARKEQYAPGPDTTGTPRLHRARNACNCRVNHTVLFMMRCSCSAIPGRQCIQLEPSSLAGQENLRPQPWSRDAPA